jgi:hypothetical protein
MYAPFLAVAVAVGTPPALAALVLAFFSNLFSSLTHYANGPAPVIFGAGYVPMGAWWGIGFAVSVLNIAIWVGIGWFWWDLIGLMGGGGRWRGGRASPPAPSGSWRVLADKVAKISSKISVS